MKQARRRAGLEVTGNCHLLRQMFCSHLAMHGAPAKAIQEVAGHTERSTTLWYMHLSPVAREAAVALLDRRPAGQAEGADGGARKKSSEVNWVDE